LQPTWQSGEQGEVNEVTESRTEVDAESSTPVQQPDDVAPATASAAATDDDDADGITSNTVNEMDGDNARRLSSNITNYAMHDLLAGQSEHVIEIFQQLMTSLSTNSDTMKSADDIQTAVDCVINFDVSEIEDNVTFTLVPQVCYSLAVSSFFRGQSNLRSLRSSSLLSAATF
jgi:hypothetical protein